MDLVDVHRLVVVGVLFFVVLPGLVLPLVALQLVPAGGGAGPGLGVAGLTQSIAAHCQLVAVEGDHWRLHLDPGHSALYNENHRLRLQNALVELEGRPLTLEVLVKAPDQETPAVAAARRRAARQRQAEESIQADPLVQALITDFSAQVYPDSIRPIDA